MGALYAIISFFWAIFFCLIPEQAFAWGPGVHFVTGNWLLQNLAFLPAAVATVLMRNPGQFLHGLLSADIFIGKGCKAKKGHSHNWESGFALQDKAQNEQQQAYAYGYLCHLAADTVAHNVFVPGLLQTAPGKGTAAHVYLEIQADSLLKWNSRDAIALFYEKDSPAALAMLQRSMRRSSLPFWFNTRLFQSSIAIGGCSLWRDSVERFDRFLWDPSERKDHLNYLLALSTRAMFNLLQEGRGAKILALDPIGSEAIAAAEKHAARGHSLLARGICRQFYKTLDRRFAAAGSGSLTFLQSFIRHRIEQPVSGSRLDVPAILESLPPACKREQE